MPALVSVGSTGKDAEKFTELEIASAKPKRPKVVMALAQGGSPHASLPDIRPGDRLLVSAEIELTADHEEQQSDSAGKPYRYEPNVEVSLLLAAGPNAITPGPKAVLLKSDGRAIGHRRHHDVVVFDNVAYDVGPSGLPWRGSSTILCAIASWHAAARSGQVLIVGQNEPQGATSGDMSSISVARIRPALDAVPAAARVTKKRVKSIPVVVEKPQKKCVYSHPLDDLRAGEQIRIRAGLKSNCRRFGYSTRTTVEVFLAESAIATESGQEARRICLDSPQFCRGNGKNTLPEDVAMDSAKVGVLHIAKNARQPMFANVVVTTGDPLKKATQGGHALDILDGGYLAVTRYAASSNG